MATCMAATPVKWKSIDASRRWTNPLSRLISRMPLAICITNWNTKKNTTDMAILWLAKLWPTARAA